jgi:glycosyltransferase involved in cell wall biosynthesis
LKKYLAESSNCYDIVHAHDYHGFPALYAAQSKDKNRLVFTPHLHESGATPLRRLLHIPYKYLARQIFEKADKVVCVSNYEKDLVVRRFSYAKDRVVIISNGINPEEFKSLNRDIPRKKSILYVGRLEKYKGVQYLIEALSKLDDDIDLEIVGKGPYEKQLLRLSHKLKASNRVKFHSDLSRMQLLQKYVESAVFVLLSKYEAYSICVAEALAAGTPCIVAKTSALEDWVDCRNCFGVSYPIDISELAFTINDVIGKKVGPIQLPTWDNAVNRLNMVYNCLQDSS